MLNIALMGYGVIGSGVAKVIEENKKLIASRLGEEVHKVAGGGTQGVDAVGGGESIDGHQDATASLNVIIL